MRNDTGKLKRPLGMYYSLGCLLVARAGGCDHAWGRVYACTYTRAQMQPYEYRMQTYRRHVQMPDAHARSGLGQAFWGDTLAH